MSGRNIIQMRLRRPTTFSIPTGSKTHDDRQKDAGPDVRRNRPALRRGIGPDGGGCGHRQDGVHRPSRWKQRGRGLWRPRPDPRLCYRDRRKRRDDCDHRFANPPPGGRGRHRAFHRQQHNLRTGRRIHRPPFRIPGRGRLLHRFQELHHRQQGVRRPCVPDGLQHHRARRHQHN